MTTNGRGRIATACDYVRENLEVDTSGFVLLRDLQDGCGAYCRKRGIEPPMVGGPLFRIFPDTKFYYPRIGGRIEPAYWGVSFKRP